MMLGVLHYTFVNSEYIGSYFETPTFEQGYNLSTRVPLKEQRIPTVNIGPSSNVSSRFTVLFRVKKKVFFRFILILQTAFMFNC